MSTDVANVVESTNDKDNVSDAERKQKAKDYQKERLAKRPNYTIPDGGIKEHILPDYSVSKYQPLKKEDFAAEYLFLLFKANLYRVQADKWEQEANAIKALGNVKDAKKARQMLKYFREFEKAKEELAADGSVDVNAILATVQKSKDAQAAAQAVATT